MNPPNRVVRVFVSSTFRDMFLEREELVKRVFPRLRKLCEERGVAWGEVDLRWGITEEQAERGEVLPVCLAEIDRCRPFFLGILGERYGWVPGPDRIAAELLEDYPWLRQHLDDSVTEVEVRHGVLNPSAQPPHAFFYLRDPLPPGAEGAEGADFATKGEAAGRKLASLKEHIRRSGHPVREGYRDAVELGEMVLADLTTLLDRLFPAGSEPDPLDREASEHEAFARERLAVYVGRDEYFRALDAFTLTPADAPEAGKGLAVLGESGSGKSALLANWVGRYRAEHPDEVVLVHHCGATPSSADGPAMLQRLLGEFRRRLGVQAEVPDEPQKLYAVFASALYRAAARGKLVLVIDALDQMEERPGLLELAWLPPVLPGNLRLVVSTLPGTPLDELRRRDWPCLEVQPLLPEERCRLITEYLRRSSKALSGERVSRIAAAEQASNPLFLRALVEELRVFGVHERLDERIGYYLAATDLDELFARILGRYEEDYERERPGLVGEAMSLLWASRRGLAEDELLRLLGDSTTGEALPQAYWSPLHLAAEHALVSRDGRLGFFHDYLRGAVERRYLPEPEQRRSLHRRLAAYFAGQGRMPRTVDELPWQLAQAGAWEELYRLLVDLDFLERGWEANQCEVRAYWVQIEENSPFRLIEGYREVLKAPAFYPGAVWTVSKLLYDTGHLGEALALRRFQAERYRRQGDLGNLSASLGNQGMILRMRGDLDGALALYQEAERLYRQQDDLQGVQSILGSQALILWTRGDLDGALALLQEQERLCRELDDLGGLAGSLGNRGMILRTRGDLDGALALHKEAEHLCRQLGNLDGLQASLGNQAAILKTRGEVDAALALLREQERRCRQVGNLDGLQASLGNQGLILRERGQLDEAMALHQEAERLCRQLGNSDGLADSLDGQAMILARRCQLDEALALHREAERLYRDLGALEGLAGNLGNQATVLQMRGELDTALTLLDEQEHLCRQRCDLAGLANSLGNRATILRRRGDLDGALALHREEEHLCRRLGDLGGLHRSQINQGLILLGRRNLDEAMALFEEAERLCRQLGHVAGLQASLGNQGLILRRRGKLDGALALFGEQERLCRQVGDLEGLATSLVNQAAVLAFNLRQPHAGLPLVEEACRLAERAGLLELLAHLEATHGKILQATEGVGGPAATTLRPGESGPPSPPRRGLWRWLRSCFHFRS